MFHFSTDRLAGLDNVILKIAIPSNKLSSVIPNHAPIDHNPHRKSKKITKRKPQGATRVPLGDKTNSDRIVCNCATLSISPVDSCFQQPNDVLQKLDNPTLSNMPCYLPDELDKAPTVVATQPCGVKRSLVVDDSSFSPLPPLPTASPLQLPSFLDLSTSSSTPHHSTSSAPTALLFCVPTEPRKRFVRKPRKEVSAGPHWIPAFHHPNSPYVPWTLPTRQRILPPPSPQSLSPDESSPCSRSGAVAPEPWTSHSFLDAPKMSRKDKVSSSWKSFKNTIKKGVKKVVAHLGKTKSVAKEPSNTQDIPRSSGDNNIIGTCNIPLPSCPEVDDPHSRISMASFSSSDSTTLASWLTERCAAAPGIAHHMSIEAYEFMGSWLDLRHGNNDWVCGQQECKLHLADGSPNAMCGHITVFRATMPFDGPDLDRTVPQRVTSSIFLSNETLVVPSRFYSLPRLPSQSFDMTPPCGTGSSGRVDAGRRLLSKKSRETSMPGGWTFY